MQGKVGAITSDCPALFLPQALKLLHEEQCIVRIVEKGVLELTTSSDQVTNYDENPRDKDAALSKCLSVSD